VKQIAFPPEPDLWSEDWERYCRADEWCYKWCCHYRECPIKGEQHTKDCQLERDLY
jgi:hypothetical protein